MEFCPDCGGVIGGQLHHRVCEGDKDSRYFVPRRKRSTLRIPKRVRDESRRYVRKHGAEKVVQEILGK